MSTEEPYKSSSNGSFSNKLFMFSSNQSLMVFLCYVFMNFSEFCLCSHGFICCFEHIIEEIDPQLDWKLFSFGRGGRGGGLDDDDEHLPQRLKSNN